MSDEEDSSDEASGSEDEEEENEDDSVASSSANKANKQASIKDDIMIIKDIFSYIDQTSRRIHSNINANSQQKAETSQNSSLPVNTKKGAPPADDLDTTSLAWSQYENLDEDQRGDLLEKAIYVLGRETENKL